MSKLKLYVAGGGNGTSTNVQLILVDGEEQYEVEKIMAECGHGNYKHNLIFWFSYSADHDLWLPASGLTQAPEVLAT